MALGASLAESNPLKAKAFREEDMRWAKISDLSRSVARLSVFSVSLSHILARAEELGIIPEDRELIQSLVLKIAQFLFSQATRVTTAVFRERRQLAFHKLGFKESDNSFVEALPLHGPFLFAGQLLDSVDQRISMRKRAATLASQLRPPRRGASSSFRASTSAEASFRAGHNYRRQMARQPAWRGSGSARGRSAVRGQHSASSSFRGRGRGSQRRPSIF